MNYLKEKATKHGLEITRDLHPNEAGPLFYALVKGGIPDDYHEGKSYLKKK